MRLHFGVRGTKRFLERLLDLGAQARQRSALLVALCGEALCVGDEADLDVRHELLLPLRELRDARFRRVRGALEILRPAGETLLDLRLRRGQRRSELVG